MSKSMDELPPLSARELEILSFVTGRAPVSVREVANEWGQPRGLARTTILTFMERLRNDGYLSREKGPDDATFMYSPTVPKSDLQRGLVQDFVQRALGGSVAPFVAYLADAPSLSEAEIAELKRLVEEMESPKG